MNILMLTNTYLPHVGGVARSVASFADQYRKRGHPCLIVAPTFAEGEADDEQHVIRVPAIQHFNGSDFSVRLPLPGLLKSHIDEFEPDIVHSHHPFLMGDTALRIATGRDLPLVFTHHTMYERYTHYVPGDSDTMRDFAIRLATSYANMSDHVFAPSESVRDVLRQRDVTAPISVVPTGIDPRKFADGNADAARKRYDIPNGAFVVGHVGRLAKEKNMPLLARAVARYLKQNTKAHAMIVGDGDARKDIADAFADAGVESRLHLTGVLEGGELVDAYHAMDVFAFASQTETQGMVLAEAMTTGAPVVAIDAPGVHEVVVDKQNGRKLETEDEAAFAEALAWVAEQDRGMLRDAALKTAEQFTLDRCTDRALAAYEKLIGGNTVDRPAAMNQWDLLLNRLETEWTLWSTRLDAAIDSFTDDDATVESSD